jgi:hypothetical protein
VVGLAILVSPATPSPAQPVLWPGNGHSYEVVAVTGGITWSAAQQAAQSSGGQLATLTSAAEHDFVFGLVSDPQFWSGGSGPWIGGMQAVSSPEPAGGWQWVTSEPWSYTNWAPGQPDNDPCAPDEDRLHLIQGTSPGSGGWDDLAGDPPIGCGVGIRPVAYVVETTTPPTIEYQTNSIRATMTVNWVWGTPFQPAVVHIPPNGLATLAMSSINTGMLWDIGVSLAPLVPASACGFSTPDGEIWNLDILDPTLHFLWASTPGPGFQNVTLIFYLPSSLSLSLQMLIGDPCMASGFSLSQPVRLIFQ